LEYFLSLSKFRVLLHGVQNSRLQILKTISASAMLISERVEVQVSI